MYYSPRKLDGFWRMVLILLSLSLTSCSRKASSPEELLHKSWDRDISSVQKDLRGFDFASFNKFGSTSPGKIFGVDFMSLHLTKDEQQGLDGYVVRFPKSMDKLWEKRDTIVKRASLLFGFEPKEMAKGTDDSAIHYYWHSEKEKSLGSLKVMVNKKGLLIVGTPKQIPELLPVN